MSMKPLPQDTQVPSPVIRQHVRGPGGRAKATALNCRRTHLGARGLLSRHPSALLWPPGDEQAADRGGQSFERGAREYSRVELQMYDWRATGGPEGEARCGTSLLSQWEMLCLHPAHVLLAFLWYKPGHGRRQGTKTFWAERSCLSLLRCSFLRRAEWPPSSYLPPPSYGLYLILATLVMTVPKLRPLRIIDFPLGEETIH